MDAAERREQRDRAELIADLGAWDRRAKWRIRAAIAWAALSLGVAALAVYLTIRH